MPQGTWLSSPPPLPLARAPDARCTESKAAELIRDHPAVGAKLLVKITQLMAQRLRNTSNHLVRLLHKQAAQNQVL